MDKKENIMDITMKLNDILSVNQTLKLIIDNDDKDKKIDPLFKFKLLGIMKSLEIPVSDFETIRNERIKKYGKENDDGNIGISLDDEEALTKFKQDIDSVIQNEVTVSITKLKATDIFNKGVPAEYLVSLLPIIEE
jgi:hypothetical protein